MHAFVGVDVAKEVHWACAIDGNARPLFSLAVPNGPEAIAALIARIEALEAERVTVALDMLGERWTMVLGDEVVIGRTEGSIKVSSNAVSRQHLRIARDGTDVVVRDLESRNGTWVNATRVREEGLLAPIGAVIRLAQTLLVVRADVSPYLEPRNSGDSGLVGGAALDEARELIATLAASERPLSMSSPGRLRVRWNT